MKTLLEVFEESCCIYFRLTVLLILPQRYYQPTACFTPLQAIRRILYRLYEGIPLSSTVQPYKTQKRSERNTEIRRRYAAGETLVDLANEYSLSKQRIHQIAIDPEDI